MPEPRCGKEDQSKAIIGAGGAMKAFPNTNHFDDGYGMDLRDYFAAKAMQGLIHHFDFMTFRDDPKRVAGWAYDVADLMMKAREK
jgi:hypothetical protein